MFVKIITFVIFAMIAFIAIWNPRATLRNGKLQYHKVRDVKTIQPRKQKPY